MKRNRANSANSVRYTICQQFNHHDQKGRNMRVYCDHRTEWRFTIETWIWRQSHRMLWPVEYRLCKACWDKGCILILGFTLPPVEDNFRFITKVLKILKTEQMKHLARGEQFKSSDYRDYVKANVRGIEASIVRYRPNT